MNEVIRAVSVTLIANSKKMKLKNLSRPQSPPLPSYPSFWKFHYPHFWTDHIEKYSGKGCMKIISGS